MKTFLTRDQFTQYYTATGGETQIPLTRTVCRTNTDFAVFRNGLFQTPGSTEDYVFIDRYGVEASNTEAFVSAIKFNTALSLNDRVSIVSGVISGTNLTDIYSYIGDTGPSVTLSAPYNLNNLIHGGRYFLAYNAGNTNCPVSVDCHIQVIQKDTNSLVQILYPTNGDSPVWRRYTDSVWSTWDQFVLNKANTNLDNITASAQNVLKDTVLPVTTPLGVISAAGTWTITGCKIGVPLFIFLQGSTTTNDVGGAQLRPVSGVLNGDLNGMALGLVAGSTCPNFHILIPSSTTVVLTVYNITTSPTCYLRAYQQGV